MPGEQNRRLSKSRVLAGQQCEKLLWLRVHEADAPELTPDAVHRALFDAGERVGSAAQREFPGGETVPYSADLSQMLSDTQERLARGAQVIFEASFASGGVFVSVDVLVRDGDAWRIVEVKSSKSVKGHHVIDAAVQQYVIESAGLSVSAVEIMHLGRDVCETGQLFVCTDVTEACAELQSSLPVLVARLQKMVAGPEPEVEVGEHCRSPRPCPFISRCAPPPSPVATSRLYRISKRQLNELLALGHDTVHTIPADFPLKPTAHRQRRALVEDRLVIDPGLLEALDEIVLPAAYIDFESINTAIPAFDDCEPFAQVPVQMSCHRVEVDGTVVHHEWLGVHGEDPRPGLAQAVVAACRGAKTLVAYSAGFERQMISHLQRHADAQTAEELQGLLGRFVDLLPIMRNFVYHPAFGGRFGLKAVTGALLPDLAYDDLVVREGGDASVQLANLLIHGSLEDESERASVRAALLAYCERDTLTMVELVKRLRAAARQSESREGEDGPAA